MEKIINTDKTIFQHGGNIILEAKKKGIKIEDIIDASASLVPYKLPIILKNFLIQNIKSNSFGYYPERSYLFLRKAIAKWHKIDESMILPGNGASELITWAAKTTSQMLNILPSPCFSDYKRAIDCWSGKYLEISLPIPWEDRFPAEFPFKTSNNAIWITNPQNPTGQLWKKESLVNLLENGNLVICDEAFLPIVPDGESQSLIPLINNYSNLIIIRSLTKLFNIAGLRLGYAISSPERLKVWSQSRDPWPMNSLAISFGIKVMEESLIIKKQTSKIQKWVKKEGPWMRNKLNSIPGLICHPSSVNYQLIESNFCLRELNSSLREKNILVRDCSNFSGLNSKWIRISLRKRAENKIIFNSIKNLLR